MEDNTYSRTATLTLPILGNLLPACFLAAAIVMPQVDGCDGRPVVPIDHLAEVTEEPSRILVIWHHWYGILVLMLFGFVLCAQNRSNSDRKLAFATIGFWMMLVTCVVVSAITNPSDDSYAIAPLVLLPSVWCYRSILRRDWISAWARLSTSIAILGIPWTFFVHLFNRGARFGIYVTYASLFILAIAPWWLRVRWKPILIGASEPATPIQFHTWHLLAATTLFAGIYGYYRYVVPMIEGM